MIKKFPQSTLKKEEVHIIPKCTKMRCWVTSCGPVTPLGTYSGLKCRMNCSHDNVGNLGSKKKMQK